MNDGNAGFLYSGYQYASLTSSAAQTHESRPSIYYQVQFSIENGFENAGYKLHGEENMEREGLGESDLCFQVRQGKTSISTLFSF